MTMSLKVAFITGITGQDGSYLAEFLLNKGYIVYGMIRRTSAFNTHRIEHLRSNSNLVLKYGDISDSTNITKILTLIDNIYPKLDILEVYHLCAQSHVAISFELPEYTGNTDALGTLKLLECICTTGLSSRVRFYNASTSELFGQVKESPQNENTLFSPRSPYAVAKLYSYWIT